MKYSLPLSLLLLAACNSNAPSMDTHLEALKDPALAASPWVEDYAGDIENELLASLAGLWWEHTLELFPIDATYTGDPRYHGRLHDLSPEAEAAHLAAAEEYLELSAAIEPTTLSSSERITLELLQERWSVDLALAASGVEFNSWAVSSLDGPQNMFLTIAADQPVATRVQRAQYIQRWSAMAGTLDQRVVNLKRGLAEGRVASHNGVLEVIAQLDEILETPIAESPLVAPAREANKELGRNIEAITRDQVYPAFKRYRDFLRDEVLPKARPNAKPGVMHVAGGDAYYRAQIRNHTSLDLSPQQIHDIGLQEIDRIRREMSVLGERVFGTPDVAEIQERMRTDPALHFETAEQIVKVAEDTLARAEAAAPDSFGILPKAPCVVVPVPAHEAPTSTIAYYRGPAADGSRPGRYYVNTYEPTTRTRYEAEVLALHEAVPGHHSQIAIAMELSELPIVRRHFSSTAYVEGWALYTERLGDEMGLYTDDVDRLGVLSFDAWRACRLVVDTGIHALGWSRDEAIDFMVENTLLARNNVENEIDRYIAWPGQALAYKLGQLEILQLRSEAKAALGDEFRLSDFHDRVLENGAVTLVVLRRVIEEWITKSQG